jgi:hypothetical protein
MTGTLFMRPELFFIPIWPRSAARRLKPQTLHCLPRPTTNASMVEIGNDGHFTHDVKTVFRPYLASNFSGMNQTSNVTLPTHVTRSANLVGILHGHSTREAGKVFRLSCARPISARCLKHQSWHSLPIRYEQCKFGRNRSLVKATLLVKRKHFFVPVSHLVAAG